ncbi:MAG TPA: alcohol dehydrogenase AdhP [Steroidobacteraceae bacterium]|jgi:propanol-preferring alcohol dehydrogenase|nr:alcohol dehydrogenase AdhP [Steroidobacteraceae bacterium]
MRKMMGAAIATSFGRPLILSDIAIPIPGPGEVLVKVAACGVCHTDIHAVDGDWPVKPQLPFIPGHEVIGHVAALGQGVTRFKEGDAIGVAWLHDACGACEYCGTGWETLCASQHNTGYSIDGGYAEYMVADAAYAVKIPAGMDLVKAAPILCAGVTTYKGIKETDTKAGDWLAISGVGGLGHVAVQYAKAMGLHVVAIDLSEDKLALARRLGADIALNAAVPDLAAEVSRRTGGMHGALITAVSAPAFAQCLNLLRPGGTMSMVGLPPGSFALPIFDVVLKRLTVRGSIVGTRQDLAEALMFAAEGKVAAQVESRRLDEINAIFSELKTGRVRGRIVLQMR